MSLETVVKSLAALCIVASSVAFSSEAPPTAAEAAASESEKAAPQSDGVASAQVSDKDDLVCRMEKPLGSNMKKRVCRTKEQMVKDAEAARQATAGSQKRQ